MTSAWVASKLQFLSPQRVEKLYYVSQWLTRIEFWAEVFKLEVEVATQSSTQLEVVPAKAVQNDFK